MIGIISYGGYIPKLRLDRMSIYQNLGWFAPAIVMVAQGERSFCNWDEDTLTMAVAASRDCLKGLDRSKIDGHFLCSTTLPFADRLNAGIVKQVLNLKDDMLAEDLTSSLRAGTSGLVSALEIVKAGDKKQILVTATDKREAKSAYFYEMWFGDGAASMLVGDTDVIAEFIGSHSVTHDFVDHFRGTGKAYDYMWEERWVRDEGYSKIIPEAIEGLFKKLSITIDDVDTLVFPCFFKAEHRNIAKKLGATPEKVIGNLHEECGETGAAHPLVMLSYALEKAEPGDRILVAGFGQGCDVLYFKVTENIKKLPKRLGIRGSLENKRSTDNFAKFQKFRDLIQVEMGIRAEAPTQTAMTVLWRKRKMMFGLVGGKCRECGTPQFPLMKICVNPKCGAIDSQDDYEFADEKAHVMTFTGDLLAVSVDPPGVYGMIEFDNGGRYMADFTDCRHEEVFVGQPVDLVFRRRYADKERGFSGYFWKAIPDPKAEKPKVVVPGLDFKGRAAVITGAGAGLGRVYALELAKLGAMVVVNDLGGSRDGSGAGTSAADKVVEEIKKLGGQAVANYDSVATAEGGAAIVQSAIDAFGRIDILINNAGILRDKSFVKMSPEDWKAVRSVHLDGAYYVTQPAFLKMKEQGFGRIVMTTSAAGLYGNFGQVNYSAAKMALIGMMNTMKLEGDRYDVRINTIAPVATTRLTEDILPPDMLEKMKPEFIASMVLAFCAAECKMSGEIINAGMGYYNRAAVLTSPGVVVGDGSKPPSVEDIHKNWEAINDFTGAVEFGNLNAALSPMLDAFNPKSEAAEEAPSGGGGGVAAVFDGMSDAFVADQSAGVDVVFQYNISGDGGGDWYVTIKDQTCTVEVGSHDSPTTTIKMDAGDFLAMMGGKLNAMKAFTSGKLKITGDMMKSQLIEKLFKF